MEKLSRLRWDAERDILLYLYRTLILSKIDYGSHICGSTSNSVFRDLDSIHYGASIFLMWFLCADTGFSPLALRQDEHCLTFYATILRTQSKLAHFKKHLTPFFLPTTVIPLFCHPCHDLPPRSWSPAVASIDHQLPIGSSMGYITTQMLRLLPANDQIVSSKFYFFIFSPLKKTVTILLQHTWTATARKHLARWGVQRSYRLTQLLSSFRHIPRYCLQN